MLALAGGELTAYVTCGRLDGSWVAGRDGAFVAYIYAGDDRCYQGAANSADPTPLWLLRAARVRVQQRYASLLDREDTVVARLTPTERREPTPRRVPSGEYLPTAQPLPAGVVPATTSTLRGRWRPVGEHVGNADAFVGFSSSGAWTGSDGCNGLGGRYVLGGAGEIFALDGPVTAVGCDNSPIGGWVTAARRVGIIAGTLLFYDRSARVLGRARR